MSLRPSKGKEPQRPSSSSSVADAAVVTVESDEKSSGWAQRTAALPQQDRIYVDNSNLGELKSTCDDAVERILTQSANSLAPAPALSPSAGVSPTSSSTDLLQDGSAAPDGVADHQQQQQQDAFPPFKASHLHADLRLALGYLSSAIIIGVSAWSYFVEKQWQKNKRMTGAAVVAYLILSALQALDAYLQGDRIFTGKRKLLSKRIETESLIISSPPLPKPTLSANEDSQGRRWIVPPTYTLDIEYARRSNGGKSLLRRVEERVTLGHLGEWFTEEGEFVQELFEKRLLGALQRAWGLEDGAQ